MGLASQTWIEVRVVVPPEAVDPISGFLFDRGSLGLTEEEGTDPTRGKYVLLRCYYETASFAPVRAAFEEGLRDALAVAGAPPSRIWIDEIPYGNWADGWKQYFKPRRVGRRLVIAPTWEEVAPEPGDIVVRIDPGLAFGTGQHETTALCLRALETEVAARPGARVLDVGTGSAVLAIASVLLGAQSAIGTDIDEDALASARENVDANAVADRVRLGTMGLHTLEGTFDVVLANILAETLIALGSDIAPKVAAGGVLILSGILSHLADGVAARYTELGLGPAEYQREGEWVALVFRRRP